MTDEVEDRMPWLGPLLIARDGDGERLYTLNQAEDFIAALLLSQGTGDLAGLPPALLTLLANFSIRANIEPDADRTTAEAGVAAYFEAHPISESLKRDFGLEYRGMLSTLDSEDIAQAALQITGSAAIAKTKQAPAEGPKGALAFFAARAAADED